MILAIRHYPDRKKPCIVLEEGNTGIVIGHLIDNEREKMLREAFNLNDKQSFSITTAKSIFDNEVE